MNEAILEETAEERDFFETGGQQDEVQDTQEATAAEERPVEAKEETKEENTIPHARFHAEMQERQRYQAEAEALRRQNEELMSLKEQLNELRQGKAQEEDSQSFDNDPLGYMKNKIDGMEQMTAQQQAQYQQAMQQQQAIANLNNWAGTQVNEFATKHEDYGDALNFVMEKRAEQLRFFNEQMGVNTPIEQILQQESFNLIAQAAQMGKNPAEIVYNMAKSQGYKKPETEAKSKLDTINKGQAASQSLAGTTSNPDVKPNVSDISGMSDEEFDAYWARYEKEARAH